MLSLSVDAQKKLGANPRATVKRHIKRLFAKMRLTEYVVRGVKDGDKQILIITNTGHGKAKR